MACPHSPETGLHCYHLKEIQFPRDLFVCCWCGHEFKDWHKDAVWKHGPYKPEKNAREINKEWKAK